MRTGLVLSLILLAAGLAGCTAGPIPDVPDVTLAPAQTGHVHTGGGSDDRCVLTRSVGTKVAVWDAMAAGAPQGIEVAAGPHGRLRFDITHGDALDGVHLKYAYYREMAEEGGVRRGAALHGVGPSLSMHGDWTAGADGDVPGPLVDVLSILVLDPEAWAARLWEARNATGYATVGFDGRHRVADGFHETTGNFSRPQGRPQGVLFPDGLAAVQEGDWVWTLEAPYQYWTDWNPEIGNATVYADAFGRFTATWEGARTLEQMRGRMSGMGLPGDAIPSGTTSLERVCA